jgi:DNA-binding beta-propeller fold protein YncE
MNPYDPEGHVWIVDDWASQVFKFTNDGSELVMTLGEREVYADDQDHFARPTDMAFLPDGNFFVSDGYVNSRIVKFNEDGERLLEWGSSGTGPGQFALVHSVKVDANRHVYVADRRNGRIQVFDENGEFLEMWDNMAQPSHIVVAQDQTVWMSDPTLNRLVQFTTEGYFLTSWGAAGSYPGAFSNPHHFDSDQDGNLYVADYSNYRVQKFVPRPGDDVSRLTQRGYAGN